MTVEKSIDLWRAEGGGWEVETMAKFIEDLIADRDSVRAREREHCALMIEDGVKWLSGDDARALAGMLRSAR